MTTDAQREANRRNAARSTGPRTAEGKRRASQNARRHGLSRPPPRSDVMTWYRLLTGADLDPGCLPRSERDHAALELAAAEAQLANAAREEERFFCDLQAGANLDIHLRYLRAVLTEVFPVIPPATPADPKPKRGRPPRDKPKNEVLLVKSVRADYGWIAPLRHLAQLVRYRKAAEVRRHKALQAWIDVLREAEPAVPG